MNRLLRSTRQLAAAITIISICMMLVATVSAQDTQYIIQRGDTLYRIAQRYNTTTDALIQANNIVNPTRILAGTTLIIPGPASASPASNASAAPVPVASINPTTHTVLRGESLGIIARRYGVSLASLMSINNIANQNRIFYGQVLEIPGSGVAASAAPDVTASSAASSAPDIGAVANAAQAALSADYQIVNTYTVQPGDYLSAIAARYGLNWVTLARVNNIGSPDNIYAGMTLNIPDRNLSAAAIGQIQAAVDPAPPRIGTGREIVVDLSSQMVYAYEDAVLQHSALGSSGLPGTPTVQGDFSVWHKTRSQTMSGPGYYLPNVEWVMYFYQGYGLHGTYWHNNFGQPMSHGCVNLTNYDAQWFYNFASIGTPVHVQW